MDISISGPKVYFAIHTPWFSINITQTTFTLLFVSLAVIITAYFLTRKLDKRKPKGLQIVVEKAVGMLYNLVENTMGKHNIRFAPYIGTLFISSVCCTLIGMTGLFRSATADLSVTLAWALATTAIVWYSKIKNFGLKGFLKGFTEPVVVMTPMNIVSEIAQPLSMAFRHFGNVAGGSVLTTLIYAALSLLSHAVFSWLPEAIAACMPPIFTAGLPAVMSIYFDLFSGFVQAFVFSLLTMIYIGEANPPPLEEKPEGKKEEKSN